MAKKHVLFDTNALPGPVTIGSPFWQLIFRLCDLTGHTPTVSELIVHESVNLVRTQLDEATESLTSAYRKLAKVSVVEPIYLPSSQAEAEEWEKVLRQQFTVVSVDGEDAISALQREALRVPPARNGKGSRDSSIWLSALRLSADSGEVKFISQNTRDFASNDGTLHPDLVAELGSRDLNLSYFNDLESLVSCLATVDPVPCLLYTSFGVSRIMPSYSRSSTCPDTR